MYIKFRDLFKQKFFIIIKYILTKYHKIKLIILYSSIQEFICDVSVEGGGKSSQPLQFSFTFYDLEGHHGKITKDVCILLLIIMGLIL